MKLLSHIRWAITTLGLWISFLGHIEEVEAIQKRIKGV
jgi:hypothetical protein